MNNYLEEMKLKKARRKELETLIGKKALLLYQDLKYLPNDSDKNISSTKNTISKCMRQMYLDELMIVDVDKECNLIAGYNDKFITINEACIKDTLIFETEMLKDILESFFFNNQDCKIPHISKLHISLKKEVSLDSKTNNVMNLTDILSFVNFDNGRIINNPLEFMPKSKVDVSKDKPFLLNFSPSLNMISLVEVSKVSSDEIHIGSEAKTKKSFEDGFYYGMNEVDNIVEDILSYYSDYFNKSNSFIESVKKLFSK